MIDDMSREPGKALQDYLAASTEEKLLRLRKQIEPPLIERLAILSVDGKAIGSAIEKAFALFVAEASPARRVNWLPWITSHAMSLLVESEGGSDWVDQLAARIPAGSAVECRAAVFSAILALGGVCQWLLLSSVSQPVLDRKLAACLVRLNVAVASLV